MRLSVRQVAEVLGLRTEASATAEGWSIDSRTIQPGELFFALRGPNHDGHVYVEEVFRKRAVAAIVDREIPGSAAAEGRVLRVEDTLQALQQLGAFARQSWRGRLVAVTGSAGKTTTKDIVAEMLTEQYTTTKNQGNLNNHIGLPLSLLRLDEAAPAAVLEIGMNHAGEIRRLAALARPDVAVVTNVGWAHIENFESIEGVAAAKRELVEALPAVGTAVLNADDPRVARFREAHPGRSVLYGMSPMAQVRAEEVELELDQTRFRVGRTRFATSLAGRHSVSNVLAGMAVAGEFGIAPERLVERVRNLKPGKMRGERLRHRGVLVYNDCYNSNPDAVRAMLDVLRDTPARKRIAVLGEMLELGRWAEPLHRDVGNYAAGSGINVLVGLRGAACYIVDAAKVAGLRADAAFFFEHPAEAGRFVKSIAEPGDAILFKGSRGVHVEIALEEFLASQKGGPR